MRNSIVLSALVICSACSSSSTGAKSDGGPHPGTDSGASDTTQSFVTDFGTAVEVGHDAPVIGDSSAQLLIYATTDHELFSFDPTTSQVTLIGPYDTTNTITDIAVNKDGLITINSESTLYDVTLPSTPGGTVVTSNARAIPSYSKSDYSTSVFALAYAPIGTLEATTEALVYGDGSGNIYYMPSGGGAVQKLGGFGAIKPTDPDYDDPTTSTASPTNLWQLSGDIVFIAAGSDTESGEPIGFATIRPQDCSNTNFGDWDLVCRNDVVVQINMTNLVQKSATANLNGGILGKGASVGSLFGLAAWNAHVYGFERGSGTCTASTLGGANLVDISLVSGNSLGTATVLNDFADDICNASSSDKGWSGAGVTTVVPLVYTPIVVQ